MIFKKLKFIKNLISDNDAHKEGSMAVRVEGSTEVRFEPTAR